jgi:hypothetical protein
MSAGANQAGVRLRQEGGIDAAEQVEWGTMRGTGRGRLWGTASVTTVALLAGASAAPAASAVPKALNQAGRAASAATSPVSATPASGTPHLPKDTNPLNVIRQIVQCGSTMYAVGRFTTIIWNGTSYSRHNIFSFGATSPYRITSWNPDANNEVDSIALRRDCSHAYIGGDFTSVHGTAAGHLASVRTSNGTVVLAWRHNANKSVKTLLLTPNGHLLVGGQFTTINGATDHPYLASVDPSTGMVQPYLTLKISGHYHFCDSTGRCSANTRTRIYNQQLSHGGTLVLEEGVFTSVGGKARQQIFMLNLATDPATVTGWTSPEWDGSKGNLPHGYAYQCWYDTVFYIRSAAWSPNDSAIYLATTGFQPWNWSVGSPRTGLCDVTAAFPATQTSVTHLWVNYTGCDSLYAVAADPSAVYVGGHPRWLNNPDGCNFAGPGAVPYRGMQALHTGSGAPLLDSSGQARYGMSEANADNMLVTAAGLWIGSTNRFGSDVCNQAPGHAGICFMPYK